MSSLNSFYQNKNNVVFPEITKYEYLSPLIASGESLDFNLGISRSFDLSRIEVNNICRLRLYISLQSRENDRNRDELTSPSDFSGCLVDSIFTSSDFSFALSPALSFVNADDPQTSIIYGIIDNTDSVDHSYNINLFVSYPLTEKLDWSVVKSEVGTKQLVPGDKIIAQSNLDLILPSSGEIYVYADGEGITVGETILKPETLYLFLYDFTKLAWKIINFNSGGGGSSGGGFLEVLDTYYGELILKPSFVIESFFLGYYNKVDALELINLSKDGLSITNVNHLNNYTKVDSIV